MTPIPPIPEDLREFYDNMNPNDVHEFYVRKLIERIAKLTEEVQTARRTAEYWKAEHLAGNTRIAQLEAELLTKDMGGSDHGPVTPDRGVPPPASRQLRHEMNCGAGYNSHGDEVNAEDCRCGLRYRIQLQTEQTMHAAWRKRAEEAEERIAKLTAEVERLRQQIPSTGDGSCDHCGAVPSIAIPTSLCDKCRDGVKRAEKAEAALGRIANQEVGLSPAMSFDACVSIARAATRTPPQEGQ